jgi:hypothetical protein
MTRGQEFTYSSRPTLRTKRKQTGLIVVVVSLLFVSALEPGSARAAGPFRRRVQWIAGQPMAVHPASSYSVTVDLVANSPQLGSIPLDLSTPAPTGPVTYWMSALAAAGSLLAGPMPAAKTVTLFKSPGSGPTNRAPAMGTISDA